MSFGMIAAGMQLAQGVMGGFSAYEQSKQVRYNASANARLIENQMESARLARIENSKRESQAGQRRLAQIESGFARSGAEISGDIANYISEVAAVQEQDILQRNQDFFYNLELMNVNKQNMEISAENKSSALKLQAFTSVLGGAAKAGTTAVDTGQFWQKYGTTTNTATSGSSGGILGGI